MEEKKEVPHIVVYHHIGRKKKRWLVQKHLG
jgi:hypothetical protein